MVHLTTSQPGPFFPYIFSIILVHLPTTWKRVTWILHSSTQFYTAVNINNFACTSTNIIHFMVYTQYFTHKATRIHMNPHKSHQVPSNSWDILQSPHSKFIRVRQMLRGGDFTSWKEMRQWDRFESLEGKLNEVHDEVFTLWEMLEKQRRKVENLTKRVNALTKANQSSKKLNKKRRHWVSLIWIVLEIRLRSTLVPKKYGE